MANYVSNYTGAQIDAGIGKANTAVQEYNIEDYVVIDYEHPIEESSSFTSYPVTITEANYNALVEVISNGNNLYINIGEAPSFYKLTFTSAGYDDEENYIIIGASTASSFSNSNIVWASISFYISGGNLEGHYTQSQFETNAPE